MVVGFSTVRAKEALGVLDTWDVLRVGRVAELLLRVRRTQGCLGSTI
jgi:hypothetical protein